MFRDGPLYHPDMLVNLDTCLVLDSLKCEQNKVQFIKNPRRFQRFDVTSKFFTFILMTFLAVISLAGLVSGDELNLSFSYISKRIHKSFLITLISAHSFLFCGVCWAYRGGGMCWCRGVCGCMVESGVCWCACEVWGPWRRERIVRTA